MKRYCKIMAEENMSLIKERKRVGRIMRADFLLRAYSRWKSGSETTIGRPRMILSDRVMNEDHSKLKERAEQQ